MTRPVAAYRKAALSQAKFRAKRRAERGLAAHNRLKDTDVRLLGQAHVAPGRSRHACRSGLR
jgi:hypothetical protein